MTLPNTFFFHSCPPRQACDTTLSNTTYKAVVDGQRVVVSWEKDVNTAGAGEVDYALSVVEGYFRANEWTMIAGAAAPVPSLSEQLVSVAAAQCYCFTVFPDGAVTLQDLSEDDPRVIDLKNVGTALKWFDLKAQLDALED